MPKLFLNVGQALELALAEAVKLAAETSGQEHQKKGGFFRLYWMPPGAVFYDLVPLKTGWFGGDSNHKSLAKYELVSAEKAIRLAHHARLHNHKSSWESRNPEHGFYGGAVLLSCYVEELYPKLEREPSSLIFSFSGLPEMADEAAMLLVAQRMQPWQVGEGQVEYILNISKNGMARELLASKKG